MAPSQCRKSHSESVVQRPTRNRGPIATIARAWSTITGLAVSIAGGDRLPAFDEPSFGPEFHRRGGPPVLGIDQRLIVMRRLKLDGAVDPPGQFVGEE